jgi:Undecaprenyl-phosphate galactose phosphotransferase WbaP
MKNGSGVEAGRIASSWSDAPPPAEGLHKVHSSLAKRVVDLAMAWTLLVFALPMMLAIAVLIKLTDPGPVLFVQRRCGFNGRTFKCYKFRSMRVDSAERLEKLLASDPAAAEEWAKYQKLRNDPRVTLIGRALRKSSLDELPQLFNIIRGDMSVVGPRPITSGEIFRYGAYFPYYTAVRPGVLGLWQVSGRNDVDYDKRVALDVEYVRNWTIWSDIKIMVRAVPVVLFASGAY